MTLKLRGNVKRNLKQVSVALQKGLTSCKNLRKKYMTTKMYVIHVSVYILTKHLLIGYLDRILFC